MIVNEEVPLCFALSLFFFFFFFWLFCLGLTKPRWVEVPTCRMWHGSVVKEWTSKNLGGSTVLEVIDLGLPTYSEQLT